MPAPKSYDFFISHTSHDVDLAKALVGLLDSAFPGSAILCTSVPGRRLESGANSREQLAKHAVNCKVLIALITEVSRDSVYMQFELGARWGTGRHLSPVLAAGAEPSLLPAPISEAQALRCEEADLHQLLADLEKHVSVSKTSPERYAELLSALVSLSASVAKDRRTNPQ